MCKYAMQHLQAAAPQAGGLPPCNCATDPVEGIKRMFVDYFQGRNIERGEDPASRPVFRRLHGVAHGTFVVQPDLPEDLRVGVFGQRSEYTAWVRFSSDVQPGSSDFKGTCGVGVKLFGVEGEKVMAPDQDATTQDFVFQNFPVFFADTARDMCEATYAALQGAAANAAYLKAHPVTAQIQTAMEQVVPTALGADYWSVIPFRFGEGRYVKYKLEPETVPPADAAPDYDDPFYLRADLHERMARGETRIRFLVQFQTDDAEMPLDRATVRWSEEASPPVHVATLVLPAQELSTRGQDTYGENLAFNPWHALPEHEPVGSIAEARKVTYRASAKARRDVNGIPLGEPVEARPAEFRPGEPYPAAKDTVVVRAAIHPAIGIARMGNSEEFFVGPEVTEPEPRPAAFYRDGTGALKRQAARFRIYGYNAAGEVVRELTPGWADVHWTAHVANRKASWYQWLLALDIPEAADLKVGLRNPTVAGEARQQLVIDGGARTIEGTGSYGSEYRFEGEFQGTPVYLGELRTDENGRLLFLGGRGRSDSPTGAPIYDGSATGFINAAGWYDDASDGPVTARVTIEGREIPVEPAWVVTAPPNYAPDLVSVRTLYDLLEDLYVRNRWMELPARVSFTEDVYPILQRMSGLQWVNRGFAAQFGWGGPHDFENPEYVARLAHDPQAGGFDTWGELRRQVFNAFRSPDGTDPSVQPWPWLYGDAYDAPTPDPDSPRNNLALTETQYRRLAAWAAGDFVADWPSARQPARDVDTLPLAEQPAMLTRAALHFCLADAFHPGCEVTWPVRHLSMYTAPFRIRHRPAGAPDPDYGPVLTQAQALAPDGPLEAQGPGDLTRWMGLPWQEDTAFCRSGYPPTADPYLPTFWPARVPNQVLSEADYATVMDASLPREERLAAFSRRLNWTRLLGNTPKHPEREMMAMVRRFGDMGLVAVRPGPQGDPDFPPVMMVETAIGAPAGKLAWSPALMQAATPAAVAAAAADPAQPSGRREVIRFRAIGRQVDAPAGMADTDAPGPAVVAGT
jgi:hypothetical protein